MFIVHSFKVQFVMCPPSCILLLGFSHAIPGVMADEKPSLAELQAQASAKLFSQQQTFAAQQAKLFSVIASGNRSAIEEILKTPDATQNGEENGKKKRKRGAPRDPDKPKRAKTGCEYYSCYAYPPWSPLSLMEGWRHFVVYPFSHSTPYH